jgi:serine/threonine protein kinase
MAYAHPQADTAASKPQLISPPAEHERVSAASTSLTPSPLFGNSEAGSPSPGFSGRPRVHVDSHDSPDGREHTTVLTGKGSYTSTFRLGLSPLQSFQIWKVYCVPATIEDMSPALQASCAKSEPQRTANFRHLQFQVRSSMRAEHEALQFLLHQKPQCIVQVESLHLKPDEQLTVRMQYAHGGNLRQFLGNAMQIVAKKESASVRTHVQHLKVGEFGVTEATGIRIMKQVLLGLSCLHNAEEACIQHRDLCADNCLVMEAFPDGTVADPLEYRSLLSAAFSRGHSIKPPTRRLAEVHLAKSFGGIIRLDIPQIQVKLCDFNISQGHHRGEERGEDLDLEVSNRWQYLAPEHRNGRMAEPAYADRADVWSAAMMMVELLGGWSRAHKTFEKFSRAFSTAATTGPRCKLPHSLPSHLSPVLRELLEHMLQPNPVLRPTVVDVLTHPCFNNHPGVMLPPIPSFFAAYWFQTTSASAAGARSGDEFPRSNCAKPSSHTHTRMLSTSAQGTLPCQILPVIERSQSVAGTEYTTSTIARSMRTYSIAPCSSALQQCQRDALYAMIAKLTYMNEQRECKPLGLDRLSARSDAWNALVGHYSSNKYAIHVRAYLDEALVSSSGNIALICEEKSAPNLPAWIRRVAQKHGIEDARSVRLSEKLARGIVYHTAQMLHLLELKHADRKAHGSIMPSSLHITVGPHLEAALTISASHSSGPSPGRTGKHASLNGIGRTIEASTDWFNLRTPSPVRIQTSDCGYYYTHMLMEAHATQPHDIKRAWLRSTCVSYLSPRRLQAIVGHELACEYTVSLTQQSPEELAELFWAECTQVLHTSTPHGWTALAELVLLNHLKTLLAGDFGTKGAAIYVRLCLTRMVKACASAADSASPLEPLLHACLREITRDTWSKLHPEDILLQSDPDTDGATILEVAAQASCISILESMCALVQIQPQHLMARASTHWNPFELVLQRFAFENGPGLSEQQMRCLEVLLHSHASGSIHKLFMLHYEDSKHTRLCEHCCVPSVDALLACGSPRELLTAISLDYLAHVEGHVMECISDDAEHKFRQYVHRLACGLQPAPLARLPLGGGPVSTRVIESNAPEDNNSPSPVMGTPGQGQGTLLEDPLSLAHASIISNISAVLVDVWNSAVARFDDSTVPSPCALRPETLTRSQLLHRICLRTVARHNHRVVASRPVHVTKPTEELFQRYINIANAQLAKCDGEACQLARAIQESASVEDDMYAIGMTLASLVCGINSVEGAPGHPPTSKSFTSYAVARSTQYPEHLPVISDGVLTVLRYLLYGEPKRVDTRTWLDTEKWFTPLWTDKPAGSAKRWLACTIKADRLDALLLHIKVIMAGLAEPVFEGFRLPADDQEALRAISINNSSYKGYAAVAARLASWEASYDGIVCDYETSTLLFPSLRVCGYTGHLLCTNMPRTKDSLAAKRKAGVVAAYGISACTADADFLRAEIRKAIGFGMSDPGIKATFSQQSTISSPASSSRKEELIAVPAAPPIPPAPVARPPGGLPAVAPLIATRRLPVHSAGVSALRHQLKVEKVELGNVKATVSQPGPGGAPV